MEFLFNVLIALGVMTVTGAAVGACCSLFDVKKKKSGIRAKEPVSEEKNLRAFIRCAGGHISERRYTFADMQDCAVADSLYGGMTECSHACLGLGSCVGVCRKGAISLKNGVAAVDASLCDGCGDCIKSCPRKLIELLPETATVAVACKSSSAGVELSELCDIGCIGCSICVNTCEYDAVKLENGIACIDYEKCTLCGMCAEVCPRGIISAPPKEETVPTAEEVIADEETSEEFYQVKFELEEDKSSEVPEAPAPIEE